MNSDKTLTCNGTYSTNYTNVSWSSPHNLTSNTSNSSFQVSSSAEHGQAAFTTWHAFDGVYSSGNTGGCFVGGANSLSNQYWLFYTPTQTKFSSITIMNRSVKNTAFKEVKFYSGNTSSCSTYDGTYTNSTQTGDYQWTVSWGGTSFTYYHKLLVVNAGATNQYSAGAKEIWISGYTRQSSYTYYWDKTVS